jgi:hypothetical protein
MCRPDIAMCATAKNGLHGEISQIMRCEVCGVFVCFCHVVERMTALRRSTPSPLERLMISIRSICSGAAAKVRFFERKPERDFLKLGALIHKEKAYPAGIRVSAGVGWHSAGADL